MKNQYKVDGPLTTIIIKYKDEIIETKVDTADLKLLLSIDNTWCAFKPTRLKGKCYVKGKLKGKMVYLHRLICKTDMMVDHINRDPLDNRKSNLRPATPLLNTHNRDIHRGGVSWDKFTSKWKAYITLNGKQKQLGRFTDEDDARKAISEAREKIIS